MRLDHALRRWTSLVVGASCLFTISSAAQVLRFALADASADSARTYGPFAANAMLGWLARERLVELGAADSARVDDVADLLTTTPMSSRAWLALAAAELASDAPKATVVGAYVMSNLTGPNEAFLMADRAAFALPLWRILPPPARSALVNDLTGGWAWTSGEKRSALRAALAIADDRTREEIRGALLSAGRPGPAIAAALGVDAEKKP